MRFAPHRILLNGYDYLKRVKPLIQKELRSSIRVPWNTRFRMWRSGFLSESHLLYGLDRNDPREYLTDAQRFIRTPLINRDFGFGLDNKIVFPRLFVNHQSLIVQVFFMIRRNAFLRLSEEAPGEEEGGIRGLMRARGKLVLKPYDGGGGKNIRLLEMGDAPSKFLINGVEHDEDSFRRFVGRANGSLICEYVEQAEYSKRIFPGSVNTLRLLTMWDDESGGPFLAAGVHRFGSKATAPVDNWTQGGVSAPIDLETGVLGRGAAYPKTGELVWLSNHPETGAAIEGLAIPGWKEVSEGILTLVRQIPFLPYVGWDVIVTDDGYKVLEGNRYSDVNLLQIHGPLLRDPRVRRFYERQGVL